MEAKAVILFDGVCNFCNRTVQFLIKHDKQDNLRFASLQSETGRSILSLAHLSPDYKESILFFEGGKIWQKSDAFCKIMSRLPGGWKLLSWIKITPRFIRDAGYQFIASHRYQWFGKREQCMIPPKEWEKKFLP